MNVEGGSIQDDTLPSILYHGSRHHVSVLEPRPSRVIEGESAVFATNARWLGLVFISGSRSYELDFGYVNAEPYIAEVYAGAFSLLEVPGYIYALSSRGFARDARLGMQNHEFISKESVKVQSAEYISNVREALASEKIRWVPSADRAGFFKSNKIPMYLDSNADSSCGVNVKILGRDTGYPSVLFIAGLGNDHLLWNWNDQSEELIRESGYPRNCGIQMPISFTTRTLSFDMPEEVSNTHDGLCKIIKCLVDRHLPNGIVIVAHSIGCLTALAYNKLYPGVRHMVLIDPPAVDKIAQSDNVTTHYNDAAILAELPTHIVNPKPIIESIMSLLDTL